MTKRIKIAVVGTGLMGLQHIKAIKKSKIAHLHSIVDIGKNANFLAKKYKVPLYKNVNALLNIKNFDAVIVATPNQLHEKHTIKFLKLKIPVLLEPLDIRVSEIFLYIILASSIIQEGIPLFRALICILSNTL